MNKTQVTKRMRELTIQIADLQVEFRARTAESARLTLLKPTKRAAPKRKTKAPVTKRKAPVTKRRKRRKTTKKAV